MISAEIKVFGRVQGVGYRYFVLRCAKLHGLFGWVKNCEDGSVEILVQGEKNRVVLFSDKIKKGNSFSRVDKVDFNWLDSEPFFDFNVIR